MIDMKERYSIKTGRFGTYIYDNGEYTNANERHEVDNYRNIELLNLGDLAIKYVKSLRENNPVEYARFLLNEFNYCDHRCDLCVFKDGCDGSPEGSIPEEFTG